MTTTPTVPVEPVKPVDAQDNWGPFAQYQYVTTAHGEFGVPAGTIMHFEPKRVFWPKEQRFVEQMWPVYTPVFMDMPSWKPNPNAAKLRGPNRPYLGNVGTEVVEALAAAGVVQAPAVDVDAEKEATISMLLRRIEELEDKLHPEKFVDASELPAAMPQSVSEDEVHPDSILGPQDPEEMEGHVPDDADKDPFTYMVENRGGGVYVLPDGVIVRGESKARLAFKQWQQLPMEEADGEA